MTFGDWAAGPAGTAALGLLRDVLTPAGFLASPAERANYRRVWARDGVVCGLAGLAAGDAALGDGLRQTVETLVANAGPQGQMPSNVAVAPGGAVSEVSYGGLAGRVDAGLWAVLGAARWAEASGDRAWTARIAPAADRSLALFDAWEFNGRGLVYVPQSGDWADEYDLHGYVLMDQVLRLAALRAWAAVAPDGTAAARTADRLAPLISATFWPAEGDAPAHVYHPRAHAAALETPALFPFASLTPGGYVPRFDALGSALALGLTDLWADRADTLLDAGLRLAAATPAGLVPAFAPVVTPADPAYAALAGTVRDTFSNRPGHYHNGGLWPMVNGWWAAALARHGRPDAARALAERLDAANALAPPFPEYLDADAGRPHGTAPLAWSAAGAVIARAACADGGSPRAAVAAPEADGHEADGHEAARAGPDGRAPTVVVAGEILVDLLSAEPADAVGAARAFGRHAGGSPANLARTLARLGVATALVATVGDDSLGRFLGQAALDAGVDLRLARRPGVPTSLAVVARSAGTPDFLLYRTADRFLAPDQLPDSLLRAARVFHTSGFALSREPARSTVLDAAARAAAFGTAVSVDVNFAPETDARRAEQLDAAQRILALGALVKSSRDDAERLFGTAGLGDAETVARYHAWGARLVCLTLGPEGALVSWDGQSVAVAPAPVTAVVDATGAGDAFWAGFLAAWTRGQSPPDCARAGARVAALKLGRAGPLAGDLDVEALVGNGPLRTDRPGPDEDRTLPPGRRA